MAKIGNYHYRIKIETNNSYLYHFSDKSVRVLSTFVDGLKIVGTEGKTTRWARLNNDPTGTKMTFEVGTGQ